MIYCALGATTCKNWCLRDVSANLKNFKTRNHLLDQNSAQTETNSELHDLYLLYFFKFRILQGKQEINLYIWRVPFSKIKRDYMVTKLYFSLINIFYRLQFRRNAWDSDFRTSLAFLFRSRDIIENDLVPLRNKIKSIIIRAVLASARIALIYRERTSSGMSIRYLFWTRSH